MNEKLISLEFCSSKAFANINLLFEGPDILFQIN